MIIDVNRFNDFVDENKQIYDVVVKEYPIHEENFIKWINNHSSDYKEIAFSFREKTRHISFSQFKQVIGSIFADVSKHILETQPEKIILYVYPECNKSNFLVALYFYQLFYINDDFRAKLYIFTDSRDLAKIATPNDIVIIPDDASYTGSQLSNFLSDISTPSSYFLAVPFMSNEGFESIKKTLSEKPGLKVVVSEQTQHFELFVNPKNPHHEKKYTIYFDHKLADSISIYQLTYAIGIDNEYENVTNDPNFTYEPLSLIKGCEVPEIDTDRYIEDLQAEVGIENMCPPPFYKMFTYTYKKKPVKDIEKIQEFRV
jgi:hypothetical protein